MVIRAKELIREDVTSDQRIVTDPILTLYIELYILVICIIAITEISRRDVYEYNLRIFLKIAEFV